MTNIPTFGWIGEELLAPGSPGLNPTWSSSDKDYVTTGLGAGRVWATMGHGVINEVYWPSTGEPQLRDLTFYLVGEGGRWVDLKRVRQYSLSTPAPYVPLPTVTHTGQDYSLTLEVLPDPKRDVLLVRYDLQGPYRLVVMAAPHMNTKGTGNVAWVDGSLFAHQYAHVMCLSANCNLLQPSAGVAGVSDGWQDLQQHGKLTYAYTKAAGNVTLSAALEAQQGVLALGFSNTAHGAWTLARSSLASGFEAAHKEFVQSWQAWGNRLELPVPTPQLGQLAQLSAAVLKMHEDRTYPGAIVASLSTPWGDHTDTLGGYHLVWPRDATLSAFALIAAGQTEEAEGILAHFIATQEADGHWAQNHYPSGDPFWTGLQLDETAFPVLLAAKLREAGNPELPGVAEMVRRAVSFVARTGPTSDQDRWEENPGANPFTLSVAIAALVAGARWLTGPEHTEALSIADEWNERLESWCYVEDTPLAHEQGVKGYYVRLAPPQKDGGLTGQVSVRNRLGVTLPASALVSLDFSYLSRLGLRQASDPRIMDTIKVVDQLLKVSTPSGDVYRRYNDDGYGEYDDGSPYDGNGIGRLWPLLCGERGHLALQLGQDALPYLQTMYHCASVGGLLPEQVWDGPAIPERGLYPGKPAGSAMPLVWAHAEYLKLLVAQEAGRPVELLRDVEQRYAQAQPATEWRWRNETPIHELPPQRDLVFESPVPFSLHYGWDGWQNVQDMTATQGTFGLWTVRFTAAELAQHQSLEFSRLFAEQWEGIDHQIVLHRPEAHEKAVNKAP